METTNKTSRKDLYMIDPRNIIVVEGFNSRVNFDIDSLCESIKENGVLNPITSIKVTDSEGNEKYRLVDGERRYRSVMKLIEEGVEIARIPSIIIPEMSDAELLVQQIVRNDGKAFNEYEYMVACDKFIKYGWERAEIAKKLGKNIGLISYYLDHKNRDKQVLDLLKDGTISGSEVRRIYSNNKGNEENAVKEILDAKRRNEIKGKKTITINDLDLEGRTIVAKDSKAIAKALEKLFYYYNKYSENGTIDLSLDMSEMLSYLKDGKLITEVFEQALEDAKKEAM